MEKVFAIYDSIRSSEKLNYLAVGFTTYLIDIFFYILLVNLVNIDAVNSSIISFIISTLISYVLTIRYVFTSSGRKKRFTLPLYIVTTALGVLITKLILEYLTVGLGVHYLISKNISIVFIVLFNYFVRKFFIFRKNSEILTDMTE
ncbi:MAG: GtrA family protein [Candidatus Dojkabacteria bacterium]|nr:MAG: GtrA family protein [Candidatus Dojkabacteria bacterium]